jgi:hypothetical protein
MVIYLSIFLPAIFLRDFLKQKNGGQKNGLERIGPGRKAAVNSL